MRLNTEDPNSMRESIKTEIREANELIIKVEKILEKKQPQITKEPC